MNPIEILTETCVSLNAYVAAFLLKSDISPIFQEINCYLGCGLPITCTEHPSYGHSHSDIKQINY